MKNFLLILLGLPCCLSALYNGNPSAPMMPETGIFLPKEHWFGLKAEYLLDWVYDFKLRSKRQPSYHSYCEIFSNSGSIVLNINDRAEIFGAFGGSSFNIFQHLSPADKIHYTASNAFLWSIGGNAILAYWGDLQFGINAAYFQSTPDLSSLKVNGSSFNPNQAHMNFSEWQIGVGISYRFAWFTPYVGVNYLNNTLKISHLNSLSFLFPQQHVRFRQDDTWGILLGLGISAQKIFSMNIESRFINENAISLNVSMKF